MPTMSPFVLLTALSLALPADGHLPSSATESDLPAVCTASARAEPLRAPPRWRSLFPTVVFGLDFQPRQDGRFDFDSDIPMSKTTGALADGATHQFDDRQMFRWTVSLRWRDRQSFGPELPSETAPLPSTICTRLLALKSDQPTGLVEATEHWIEVSRLEAMLGHSGDEEASHD